MSTISVFTLLVLCLAVAAQRFDVSKEAKIVARKSCKSIMDDNIAPPILFAAADVVLIGKAGAVGKWYGDGNRNFDISVTPHCLLKGNADKNEITVRKLGPGKCGPVNVEENDPKPYLFFLIATSDPSVYDIVNLGAKKLMESGYIWNPVFIFFCKMKKTNVCAAMGIKCVDQCHSFSIMPEGSCISYEQNVIDAYKALKEEMKKLPTTTTTTITTTTTTSPTTTPTTTTTTTSTTTKKATPMYTKIIKKVPSRPKEKATSAPMQRDFKRIVLRELVALREVVKENNRLLSDLTASKEIQFWLPVTLPLKTTADLEILEEWLKVGINKQGLVNQLALVGRFLNTRDTTRRILKRLLGPSLAVNFSFSGGKGKKLFRETITWTVICSAVFLRGKGVRERDIELSIDDFLKHSTDSFRSRH